MSRTTCFEASAILLAFGLLAIAPSSARAQAFVPAQGEGAVSFMFSDQFYRYHLSPTTETDAGQIYVRTVLADVTYGLTDKIAISVGLPIVATRYNGLQPHMLNGSIVAVDDGTWHATAQDVRIDLRYNVTRNLGNTGIVLTPFVGSIAPSHSYDYYGHGAYGRDLHEVEVGASAAKLFERGIPGLLIQGRYAYGFVQQVVNIPHNRSLMSLEAAYFVTPKLRVLGLGSGQRTHGGIDFLGGPIMKAILTPEQFLHHDQIQEENILSLGGGASYSLTDSLDLFGSLLHTVAQRNGHELSHGLQLGLSWSFTTAHARKSTTTVAENSLARCLCEKGTK
jgi:hypothetical protein